MNYKILSIVLVILFVLGGAYASAAYNDNLDGSIKTQDTIIYSINVNHNYNVGLASDANTIEVLKAFGVMGNAKVNVAEKKTGAKYGVTIKDNTVQEIISGDLPDPDYTVNVNATAYDALYTSKDPATTAINELKAGNITITAHGFIQAFQLFFFNVFLMFK